jgi:hypothetical protein
MGELACFRGLKFKMTFKILLAIWGRARIRMEREFRVASTSTASLFLSVSGTQRAIAYGPDVFLKYCQHSVQQSRGFCFETFRRYEFVIWWYHGEGDFEWITTLQRTY